MASERKSIVPVGRWNVVFDIIFITLGVAGIIAGACIAILKQSTVGAAMTGLVMVLIGLGIISVGVTGFKGRSQDRPCATRRTAPKGNIGR